MSVFPSDMNSGGGCIAADMCTAFVSSNPYDYSTIDETDLAVKVPLGSQLNLLSQQTAGNPYLNYARDTNMRTPSLANVLQGYNTLGQQARAGQYFTFSGAYGRL
jgi:hypothetical protein